MPECVCALCEAAPRQAAPAALASTAAHLTCGPSSHAGSNNIGQLGLGRDVNGSAVPAIVGGGTAYSQVAVSKWSGYVCGIRADDQTLECFGELTAAAGVCYMERARSWAWHMGAESRCRAVAVLAECSQRNQPATTCPAAVPSCRRRPDGG